MLEIIERHALVLGGPMSRNAEKSDVWVLAISASLFMLTAFVLAPLRITDQGVLGYIGSIAGGVAGGAMTVFAGWLAWRAAMKGVDRQEAQIHLMQKQLDLATDEHLKRLLRFYAEAHVELDRAKIAVRNERDRVNELSNKIFGASHGEVAGTAPITNIESTFLHEDRWRGDQNVITQLRLAASSIDDVNNKGGIMPAESVTTLMTRRSELLHKAGTALSFAESALIDAQKALGVDVSALAHRASDQ